MPTSTSSQHEANWENLPLDVLFEIGRRVIELGGDISAMREVSKRWRSGALGLDARLVPLGPQPFYTSFSHTTSVDYAMRNGGVSLTSSELEQLCALPLKYLNLAGAYKISTFDPLARLPRLETLVLNCCTVTDDHLKAFLPQLYALTSLSLQACAYVRDVISLLESSPAANTMQRLDLADCGLALHLNVPACASLSSLTALRSLNLGGNGVSDLALEHLSALQHLTALWLSGTEAITDGGIEAFAEGPAKDMLKLLDLQQCRGLTQGSLSTISRLRSLCDLRLPGHLLQVPLADGHAAALWRWPNLQRLSVGGAMVHPSWMKVIGATCGAHLTALDISVSGSCLAGGQQASRRGHLSRVPPTQLRDLLDAAKSLRQLRELNAAGTGLPLEAVNALLKASSLHLEVLDLRGCALAPHAGRFARGRAGGRWWTSGVYMPEQMECRYTASTSAAMSSHALSMSMGGGGSEVTNAVASFACALGGLSRLRVLHLAESGVSQEHLRHVSCLQRLESVSLAGNQDIGDAEIARLVPSALTLRELDVSLTSVSDKGLGKLKCCTALRSLRLARCRAVSALGFSALLRDGEAKPGRSIRELDCTDCPFVDDEAVALLAAHAQALNSLRLAGCTQLTPVGLASISKLSKLRHVDLARCAGAVTNDGLRGLCGSLSQLTTLSLAGATGLTREGLSETLSLVSCLAELDLTCVSGLGPDEGLEEVLPRNLPAIVELPHGGNMPQRGSPLKRRRNAAVVHDEAYLAL